MINKALAFYGTHNSSCLKPDKATCYLGFVKKKMITKKRHADFLIGPLDLNLDEIPFSIMLLQLLCLNTQNSFL